MVKKLAGFNNNFFWSCGALFNLRLKHKPFAPRVYIFLNLSPHPNLFNNLLFPHFTEVLIFMFLLNWEKPENFDTKRQVFSTLSPKNSFDSYFKSIFPPIYQGALYTSNRAMTKEQMEIEQMS